VDEWQHLGRALLQQGLVSETTDMRPVLKLNVLSKEILRRQREVQIAVRPVSTAARKEKADESVPALDAESARLFHHLRNLRKQLADERGVAPYVVFPDTTLRAMAQQRPQSLTHFGQIPGVGKSKLEAYFTIFTNEIRAYCEQHKLAMGLIPEGETKKEVRVAVEPAVQPSATRLVTLEMYQKGMSIEEIAQERNLKLGTIMGHIGELIEQGEIVDFERVMRPERYEVIVKAWQKVEGEALKPVKELLGEEYSYDEIRLVRSMMRCTR